MIGDESHTSYWPGLPTSVRSRVLGFRDYVLWHGEDDAHTYSALHSNRVGHDDSVSVLYLLASSQAGVWLESENDVWALALTGTQDPESTSVDREWVIRLDGNEMLAHMCEHAIRKCIDRVGCMEEQGRGESASARASAKLLPSAMFRGTLPSAASESSDSAQTSPTKLDTIPSIQHQAPLSLSDYIPAIPKFPTKQSYCITGNAAVAAMWDEIDETFNELLMSLERSAFIDKLTHSVWPPVD